MRFDDVQGGGAPYWCVQPAGAQPCIRGDRPFLLRIDNPSSPNRKSLIDFQRTPGDVGVRQCSHRYGLFACAVCSSHSINALQGRIRNDGCGCVSHDNVTEVTEEWSLEGFAEEVTNHLLSGAIQQVDVTFGYPVFDEEKSDVNVAGTGPSRLAAIPFHAHRTHVVLV